MKTLTQWQVWVNKLVVTIMLTFYFLKNHKDENFNTMASMGKQG